MNCSEINRCLTAKQKSSERLPNKKALLSNSYYQKMGYSMGMRTDMGFTNR